MKALIKSKLVLSLSTLVVVAAITIPLSGKITPSRAASASSQASWGIVPSPSPSIYSSQLNAVTTYSSTNAWAVGYFEGTPYNQSLIEHWNSTSWTQQTSPNPGTFNNEMYGVKALSVTDVWAVGHYTFPDPTEPNNTLFHSLILHTTDGGNTWSEDTADEEDGVLLEAIDGDPSSGDAWAVGYRLNSSGGLLGSVTLHLANGHFSEQPNPFYPSGAAQLLSVSEYSSNDVWAAGSRGTIHWEYSNTDGKYEWVEKANPNNNTELFYVVNIGLNNAWAIGNASPYSVLSHWDGSAWSTPVPVTVGHTSVLDALAADGSGNIWAGGAYSNSSTNTPYYTLIWRSSDGGATWHQETTENDPNYNINIITAIAIGSTTNNTWAVGQSSEPLTGSVQNKTLIETVENNIYGGLSFETSLAIDPNNPSHIVVGFIAFPDKLCSWAESTDAGASWITGTLNGPAGLSSEHPLGDPWVRFGLDGTLFYSCLMATNNPDGVFVRIATTGKASDLNNMSTVVTMGGVKVDHPSIGVLKMSSGNIRLVECWSETKGNSDVVNVAYSDFPAITWSKPKTVSLGLGNNDYCTIGGGNGLIAVSWANVQQNSNIAKFKNTLQFKVSTDGATWSPKPITLANAGTLVNALDGTGKGNQISTTDKVLSVPYVLIVPNGTGLRAFYEVRVNGSSNYSQVNAVDLNASGKPVSTPKAIGEVGTETFLPGAGTCSNVVGMYQGILGQTADFRYTVWSLDPQTGTWTERLTATAASNAQSAIQYPGLGRRIGDYTGVDCTTGEAQVAWADTRDSSNSTQPIPVDIWGASVGLP